MTPADYFLKLHRYGATLLDRLPIELTPQPLAYALGRLAPRLDELRAAESKAIRALGPHPAAAGAVIELGVGLNSVGMLTDRLTILILKEWCLRHKNRAAAKADALFEGQTRDIAAALAAARPGSSSMNSKITIHRADAAAGDWAEAFYGLLSTNLLMWESQEMLYVRDLSTAPGDELRDYIQWFSRSNIRRNEYIALCEDLYWRRAA